VWGVGGELVVRRRRVVRGVSGKGGEEGGDVECVSGKGGVCLCV
jgi:hypothetical protein